MENLLPCPFCGGEARLRSIADKLPFANYFVECKRCSARAKTIRTDISTHDNISNAIEMAEKAWNTRRQ